MKPPGDMALAVPLETVIADQSTIALSAWLMLNLQKLFRAQFFAEAEGLGIGFV